MQAASCGSDLGDILVQEAQGKDRQGSKQEVVQGLQPVVIQALPGVGGIQVEPKLNQGKDCVLVEEVPAGGVAAQYFGDTVLHVLCS